jgi:hypothetical protein
LAHRVGAKVHGKEEEVEGGTGTLLDQLTTPNSSNVAITLYLGDVGYGGFLSELTSSEYYEYTVTILY